MKPSQALYAVTNINGKKIGRQIQFIPVDFTQAVMVEKSVSLPFANENAKAKIHCIQYQIIGIRIGDECGGIQEFWHEFKTPLIWENFDLVSQTEGKRIFKQDWLGRLIQNPIFKGIPAIQFIG